MDGHSEKETERDGWTRGRHKDKQQRTETGRRRWGGRDAETETRHEARQREKRSMETGRDGPSGPHTAPSPEGATWTNLQNPRLALTSF